MTNERRVPLPRPIHDIYNFEHDMVVGPCACGAWHHSPSDYLDRLPAWHIHAVNPPCDGPECSYCVARRFLAGPACTCLPAGPGHDHSDDCALEKWRLERKRHVS